jgi:diacylglycerol kinase family enzyme
MSRRFFLIFNPGAGTSRRAFLDKVVARLHAHAIDVAWAGAKTAEAARSEARAAARSGTFAAVIAAGGDGTIRQAAAGVAGTPCPIGAIPLGTGNVLAHEIAISRTPEAIASMLVAGQTLPVELGLANGEPFLLMAGAGFDGRIVGALDHRVKASIAKAAYVMPSLRALAAPLDRLDVSIDGRRHEASWAVICNARHYGGAFVMAQRTHLSMPGLSAVLFHSRSRPHLVSQLLALATGRLEARAGSGGGDVTMITCERVEITSASPAPVQIDGDAFGMTPLTVTRGGGVVKLIVPPR